MRISDWSSDVCSSDLDLLCDAGDHPRRAARLCAFLQPWQLSREAARNLQIVGRRHVAARSEEHTSELQSLMRISYAVFCLKKKNQYDLRINQRNGDLRSQKVRLRVA